MESIRPLLTTYAYNILGSVDEAQDVVQDAYLKFIQRDTKEIEEKKAYLIRMVINLSINRKKQQQKIVTDSYPGRWLPEPVATEMPDTAILRKEILSYSLMVLLERLNPRQRAVFILNEAFDYDHEEIARVLAISPDNSRKILSRARKQLQEETPAPEKKVPAGYLDKYLDVIRTGDTSGLEKLLAEDIMVLSDGGGKVSASRNPVLGRESATAFILGIYNKFYSRAKVEQRVINHQPALFYYRDGRLSTCQIFVISGKGIRNFFFIRNPDKLRRLEK